MKRFMHAVLFLSFVAMPLHAAVYPLPAAPNSVIGEIQYVTAKHEDTFLSLGRQYGVGFEEMVAANPGVDAWVPGEGTRVLIPSRFILPNAKREGIIVNLSEHRIYYFPKPKPGKPAEVQTFPVSIGKMDWKTPLGLTHVATKIMNPTWYPPESVRDEHASRGDFLPRVIPPGPNNPLGEFAMRLAITGGSFLIHGTNNPDGIGMDVTHGCVRMFPEDIEFFFREVPVNTPVLIVNQPHKMGWSGDKLYMEIHKPLEGSAIDANDLTNLTRLIVTASVERSVRLDWASAEKIYLMPTGVPTEVSLAE
jgi:L,D-transpeptidase ErfK/SrfK